MLASISLAFTVQIIALGMSVSSRRTITGIVYGAGGVPISGVSIVAKGTQGFGYTTTNGNGQYTITQGLKSGTYKITAEQPGYLIAEKDGVTVTAPSLTSSIDLYLNASASISGRVTDNVTRIQIPNISVVATLSSGGGAFFGSALTDLGGNYEINMNIGTGIYNVTAFLPKGHISQTIPLVNATAGARTTHVDMSLQQSGIIMGSVTTSTNQPLANITVVAASLTGGFGEAETDTSGNYSITSGLGAGEYTVSAYSGTSSDSKNVSITQDVPLVSDVNLHLAVTPSGIITGTVTDADDSKAVLDAHVQATGLTQFNYGDAYTDPSGNYIISSGLESNDNYTVAVSAVGYQDAYVTNVPVLVGQLTPNVNIQLHKIPASQSGRISGTVTGDPAAIPEFEYPIAITMIITLIAVTLAKTSRRKNKLA